MIYSNMVQVLDESQSRMTQHNLYNYSHSKNGYSFYNLVLNNKSTNEDMQFIEDTLTRQGIPCVIYPDRLEDYVIIIKFDNAGEIVRREAEYKDILEYPMELHHIELDATQEIGFFITLLLDWDNQIQKGNIFSIKQFMKPSES